MNFNSSISQPMSWEKCTIKADFELVLNHCKKALEYIDEMRLEEIRLREEGLPLVKEREDKARRETVNKLREERTRWGFLKYPSTVPDSALPLPRPYVSFFNAKDQIRYLKENPEMYEWKAKKRIEAVKAMAELSCGSLHLTLEVIHEITPWAWH